MSVSEAITTLLASARHGDREALPQVFSLVYHELHQLAHRELARFRPGETLVTTALVHEAYLRLVNANRSGYADRQHFYAVAATAMRQIIVDHARQRGAAKRGQGLKGQPLDGLDVAAPDPGAEIVAIDEALTALGEEHERLARVVELRYFVGLSVEETAEVMDLSPRTVKREWQKARAFLYRALHAEGAGLDMEG